MKVRKSILTNVANKLVTRYIEIDENSDDPAAIYNNEVTKFLEWMETSEGCKKILQIIEKKDGNEVSSLRDFITRRHFVLSVRGK